MPKRLFTFVSPFLFHASNVHVQNSLDGSFHTAISHCRKPFTKRRCTNTLLRNTFLNKVLNIHKLTFPTQSIQ